MSSNQNASACQAFYDRYRKYQPAKICQENFFCCGPCIERTCCNDSSFIIYDQSLCGDTNDVTRTPNTQFYMNVSLESIIEICFLTVGLLVVMLFIYLKIRERVKRQSVMIAPIELMNSTSTSSMVYNSSPPPYPSNGMNELNPTGQSNGISTLSVPPPYSEIIKDPSLFLHSTQLNPPKD